MESGPGKDFPEHLQEMFHKSSINPSEEQQNRFRELLEKHSSVFASSDLDLGEFSAVKHTIETGGGGAYQAKNAQDAYSFCGGREKTSGADVAGGDDSTFFFRMGGTNGISKEE